MKLHIRTTNRFVLSCIEKDWFGLGSTSIGVNLTWFMEEGQKTVSNIQRQKGGGIRKLT